MNEEFSTVSLAKGSNRAYGGTLADWSLTRLNSFLKIANVSTLYTVIDKEKHFFIKKFENKGNATILFSEDVSEFLLPGDDVKISFKEYLIKEFSLTKSGAGYSVGDLLEIENESSVNDTVGGKSLGAFFKVEDTGESGEIKKLSLENRGRYLLDSPKKDAYKMRGGYGSGAEVETEFEENGNTKIVEKTVMIVDPQGPSTVVTIDSPFQQNIKTGKMSFEKWSLELKHPHKGESVLNREVTITRDFTPHCGLPIIPGTNDVAESHYNKAITILDQKIAELENKINNL